MTTETIELIRPSLSDIKRAQQRVSRYTHLTPVIRSQSLDGFSEASLFFKCENFQKIGAFKMRGATNAILSLHPDERVKGVATHSSGNHAQAVALAAKLSGIKAHIVMPKNSPKVKRDAVAGYGAEIILCDNTLEAREATLEAVISKTGAIFIPPYDDYAVIAGQATAAKELIEEIDDLDAIITSVGGGGLLSGTALTVSYISPNIKVYAGEPENADDAYRSFKSGQLQPVVKPDTIADGLKTSLGVRNFEIIKELVTDIFTVSEEEIITSMRLVWERMKIIIEPSSAVAVAAILKQKKVFTGKKVGVILTGGNVDLGNLPF